MAATGFDGGFDGGNATGGGGDVTAPVITVVSPTPGVAPGDPGGFSADWEVARMTPVVVQITDLAPGNVYQCLALTYGGTLNEIVVYRRGAFRGEFVGPQSTVTAIANGAELAFRPAGGWPNTGGAMSFTLDLDAIDAAGNLAP